VVFRIGQRAPAVDAEDVKRNTPGRGPVTQQTRGTVVLGLQHDRRGTGHRLRLLSPESSQHLDDLLIRCARRRVADSRCQTLVIRSAFSTLIESKLLDKQRRQRPAPDLYSTKPIVNVVNA
jgi:hypothetical protein